MARTVPRRPADTLTASSPGSAAADQAGSGPMPRREQWALVVFSTWAVTGLFLDGWSHIHDKPETFFTPWHGLLYSGFAAGVLWSGVEALRQGRRGTARTRASTAGARLTTAGIVVFVVGGVGDGAWHELFGIEADLAALLSPTHLALMAGGLLLVSAPFRAAWATDADAEPTFTAFLPTLLSLTIATALAAFFLMWNNPLTLPYLGGDERADERAAAGYLIGTVLLLGPALLLLQRWRPPPGSFTLLFAAVAVLETGLRDWDLWGTAIGPVLAGVALDAMVSRRRGRDPRTTARVIGLAAPAVLWLPSFAFLAAVDRFEWEVHLWTGTTFLAMVLGLGLSVLAFPPAVPRATGGG